MRPARPRAAGVGVWRTDLDAVAQFRESTDATRGYDVLTGAFPPGTVNPTAILVDRPGGAVRPQDVAEVARRAQAVPGVAVVSDTGRRSADGRAAVLSVIYEDDPFGPAALERTELLREELGGRESGLRVLVGSGSGERLDALDASVRDARVIVPLVLLVVFVTLVVLLRAVVAPLVLLATVILSFAGTLGASLLAFKYLFDQDGNNPELALVIFIFLVALGSDYNIFLMSRVREEAARHGTGEGMLRALAATGPVITSAGLILAGTFAVLTVLPSWDLFKIGFAIAVGVLVDTFLVRSLCVPALTWLLGERMWWPSSAEQGRRSTLVSGVYTTRELLGGRAPESSGGIGGTA